MLTLYFSGTGNTKFVAELFSRKMDAKCFSIEDDVDFSVTIKAMTQSVKGVNNAS